MKTLDRNVFQLFFGTLVLLLSVSLFSNGAYASVKPIHCKTTYGEKEFTIEGSSIAFHSEDESGRSMASIIDARTHKTYEGFSKTLYVGGNKHKIHIDNKNKFNEINDYMAITSPKGHEMTYPIECKMASL